ncbi:ABC transporter permease [Candidatus Dependentiae bacterium]|nr:ABC transporter permease [Candidatus Dependentiae bacterium]
MHTLIMARNSFRVLRKHKIRSFLTILGIMIGIAAIIATLSIGRGAEESIRKQVMGMGENAIFTIPGNVITRGNIRSDQPIGVTITKQDMRALRAQMPEIKQISRIHWTLQPVRYGDKTIVDRTLGVDENMLIINNHSLRSGNFFSHYHVQHGIRVAVLGEQAALKLFGKVDPIGKTIHINDVRFLVIGVINHVDHFWGTEDPNRRILIPFTAAKKYIRKPDETDDDAGALGMNLYQGVDTEAIVRRIRRAFRFMHNVKPHDPDNITIFDQKSIEEAATKASTIIKLFGLVAASISLIVGGIGVMNIMLVSVKERTREIGLRMAIGATQQQIRHQFLMEAIILTSFGGFLGIVLGLILQYVISITTTLPGVLEFLPLIMSFIVTVLVGIFFGYYPAYKASRLNPVDALLER